MQHDHFQKVFIKSEFGNDHLYALLGLPIIAAVYFVPYYFIWKDHFSQEQLLTFVRRWDENKYYYVATALGVALVGAIVHEFMHGTTWAMFSKNGYKDIRYGFITASLTPCCHCIQSLKINHFRLGVVMPGLILGVLPAVTGVVFGQISWVLFGGFFTMAAYSDFKTLYLLRRESGSDWVDDLPDETGFFVYRTLT